MFLSLRTFIFRRGQKISRCSASCQTSSRRFIDACRFLSGTQESMWSEASNHSRVNSWQLDRWGQAIQTRWRAHGFRPANTWQTRPQPVNHNWQPNMNRNIFFVFFEGNIFSMFHIISYYSWPMWANSIKSIDNSLKSRPLCLLDNVFC